MRSVEGFLGVVLSAAAVLSSGQAAADEVELFDGNEVASIVHADERTFTLAAHLLARDLGQLTGRTVEVSTDLAACRRLRIVAGENGLGLAVQLDEGPPELVDFRTFGRSEE